MNDILAHLTDWEQRFLGWYAAGKRGEQPEVPGDGYGWEAIDELNQMIYQRHKGRPMEEIQGDFDRSYEEIRALVTQLTEREIGEPGVYAWLGPANLASYILANTANHYRWAKSKIRAWWREQTAES